MGTPARADQDQVRDPRRRERLRHRPDVGAGSAPGDRRLAHPVVRLLYTKGHEQARPVRLQDVQRAMGARMPEALGSKSRIPGAWIGQGSVVDHGSSGSTWVVTCRSSTDLGRELITPNPTKEGTNAKR